MDRYPDDWLRLREPLDRAARSRPLGHAFLASVAPGARLLDLGAGTGANGRYLESLKRQAVGWRLVDADPALLQGVHGLRGKVKRHRLDLARQVRQLDLDGLGGVTASAFCDLVSARWFAAMAARAARRRLPMLFALTVDGRVHWSPPDAADAAVMSGFRRDQRRDKGFGPALGPAAPWHMAACLRRFGYRVRLAQSDWHIPADAMAMLQEMVTGIAAAAIAGKPAAAGDVAAWRARREGQIAAGSLSLTVGHRDCLAVMPRRSRLSNRGAQRSPRLNLP